MDTLCPRKDFIVLYIKLRKETLPECIFCFIILTEITTPQNEDVLSYHRVRGLYVLAVIFAATIYYVCRNTIYKPLDDGCYCSIVQSTV